MRLFGLIGHPVAHSNSARYFGRKFREEGLSDCRYELYDLDSIEALDDLLEAHPDLCGLNVTIPYKRAVIPRLDTLSDEAAAIGAVNCIRRRAGRLEGFNTDVTGLRGALGEFLGTFEPEHALILGTGGASQAVQYVLAERGIAYDLVSRSPLRGNYTYDNLPCEAVAESHLIINATPLGTWPETDSSPRIPYAYLSSAHYLFDLVYNPPLTEFLDFGRQRGARISNGERMFRLQAEAAWEIWNSR